MRPLGLSDTIFYNLGDCFITAAAALDGPCDLGRLMAELSAVATALPALGERPVRLGPWSFVRKAAPIDLCAHVAVVRDPAIRDPADLIACLEHLRRNAIRGPQPPWRILVVNPADPDAPAKGSPPLSAVLLQMRHGLADATRGLQVLGRMAQVDGDGGPVPPPTALRVIDLSALPRNVAVHDSGLSVIKVPRRGMNRDGYASERFTAVAAAAVADNALFPNARPLRGNVGSTRFVVRRTKNGALGNHLKMLTVRTGGDPARNRASVPGLSRAQELPLMEWLVATAPRRVARLMMRIWYTSFDAIATLLPMPRRLLLGGRAVTDLFGVPPLWGPVPLVLVALAGGDHYHVTVVPGRGFAGSRAALLEKLTGLLNPDATLAPVGIVTERPVRASVPRLAYGQGAAGSMLSSVSRPLSAKSP